MKKDIVISYDDLYEGNDRWEEFEKLHDEFPDIKITFFVITGHCSDEFLRKIKQPWTQLVFHSWEHSGHWLKWSVEETKEWLLKFQAYGFEKGFKAPGWRLTDNIRQACKELGFWICSASSVPVEGRHWYTYDKEGFREYPDYTEYYDHIQHQHYDGKEWIVDAHVFDENMTALKTFLRENPRTFKFITEKLIA